MNITPLHPWIAQKVGCSTADFNHSALDRYQLERLNWVIHHVKQHSRFYRNLFSNAPDSIRSTAELSAFPFTTAEDLRTDPNRFVCVPQDEVQRIVTLPTSGTTGDSKRVFFSAVDQELTVDFFKVGMSTLTKPDNRVLILLPGIRPGSVGDLLKAGLERLGCTAEIYGPVDDEEKVLQTIRTLDANVLVGAPVHLHRLARWDEAFHILPKGQVRSVLSSTDTLANTIRTNLQSIWGCEVFDHWGMTETGLGGGVECAAHQGFHLRAADLFIEIIDPKTGQLLPAGETGEVVVTTLTRTAMPLIRYRTGDLSRMLPGGCACGSFITRLDRITSRVDAGIQLESGLLTQSMLDEFIFQIPGILDFSVNYRKQKSDIRLLLSICTIRIQNKNIEHLVFDICEQIPVIYNQIKIGNLELDITTFDTSLNPNSDMLRKRLVQKLE